MRETLAFTPLLCKEKYPGVTLAWGQAARGWHAGGGHAEGSR